MKINTRRILKYKGYYEESLQNRAFCCRNGKHGYNHPGDKRINRKRKSQIKRMLNFIFR